MGHLLRGRLERLGVETNQQRWRYNYRNRFGFHDGVDAAFDALWAADDLGLVGRPRRCPRRQRRSRGRCRSSDSRRVRRFRQSPTTPARRTRRASTRARPAIRSSCSCTVSPRVRIRGATRSTRSVGAGYRVLVPDQRGYGASSAPTDVDAYRSISSPPTSSDCSTTSAPRTALFVGHDWGSLVVWDLSRLHPDRVRGLVNVSVPYTAWPAPPTDLFRALFGDRFFYILYFQEVGPAEAELEADVAETMRLTLWGGSGEMFGPPPDPLPPMEGTGFLDVITRAPPFPTDCRRGSPRTTSPPTSSSSPPAGSSDRSAGIATSTPTTRSPRTFLRHRCRVPSSGAPSTA